MNKALFFRITYILLIALIAKKTRQNVIIFLSLFTFTTATTIIHYPPPPTTTSTHYSEIYKPKFRPSLIFKNPVNSVNNLYSYPHNFNFNPSLYLSMRKKEKAEKLKQKPVYDFVIYRCDFYPHKNVSKVKVEVFIYGRNDYSEQFLEKHHVKILASVHQHLM